MKTSCVVEQTTQRGEPGGGGAASSSSSSSSKSTVRVGSGALKGAFTGASFTGASAAAARLSSSSSLDESPPVGGSAAASSGPAPRARVLGLAARPSSRRALDGARGLRRVALLPFATGHRTSRASLGVRYLGYRFD